MADEFYHAANSLLPPGSLLLWVDGVMKYHTTLNDRVKPLHAKVKETSSSIGELQLSSSEAFPAEVVPS